MCGSSACILASKLFSLYFIIHVSCMIVQVISSVGVEGNQGVEKVSKLRQSNKNHKCHDLLRQTKYFSERREEKICVDLFLDSPARD